MNKELEAMGLTAKDLADFLIGCEREMSVRIPQKMTADEAMENPELISVVLAEVVYERVMTNEKTFKLVCLLATYRMIDIISKGIIRSMKQAPFVCTVKDVPEELKKDLLKALDESDMPMEVKQDLINQLEPVNEQS